jgi:hypothetical protein
MYFTLGKLRIKKLQASNRVTHDVKWRVLDFSQLLHFALNLSVECHRLRRGLRPVAFRSQMYRRMPTTTLQ